jgi:hypothetical protein
MFGLLVLAEVLQQLQLHHWGGADLAQQHIPGILK